VHLRALGQHLQIGKNLFKAYFANIAFVKKAAKIANKDIQDANDALRDASAGIFESFALRLKKVGEGASDTAYVNATMEVGIYAAMMMQAALEDAEARGKSAEEKAKIITICADLVVIGVTAGVASHFPPVLAVIPAALTFVSTHVVPYFVPKTDFRAPLLHMRAAAKAGSLGKVTKPIDGRLPTMHEMQQRLFYHEIFFASWDIVADACAGGI
jgi:hypothetical protein